MAIVLGLALFAVIVLPQVRLLRAAFVGDDGGVTLEHVARFLGGVRYREALANTALCGVLSTALALAIGVPIGFAYARYRLPGRTAVLTLATLSTVSPPFLGAYVWMMLLGWSGPLSRGLRSAGIPFESLLGFHGIVWVTVWSSVGLVILFAHDSLAGMDPSLEEAAHGVGARPWRATLGITLPLAAPGILTAAYLILMAVLTDFGTPKIVGGDVPMLPVLVYHDYLAEVSGNPSMAATASLAMLAISTLLLMLQRLFLARRGYAVTSARRATPRPVSRRACVLVSLATALVLGLVFVPHLGVLALSFATWRADVPGVPLTLANYGALLRRSASPIAVSYALALASTVVALALGAVLAYVVVRRSYRLL
ncbi:MAG TPA: ABC transporter permease subunit, partial [Vicinamibacteria bacterium]|nr:ABC transporter permease subunit [Vicinamibacteria bacterium]